MTKPGTAVDRDVGRRVRALRERAGLTLAVAAAGIAVTPLALEAIEQGKVRAGPNSLYALALIFNVGVTAFFDDPHPDEGATGADEGTVTVVGATH